MVEAASCCGTEKLQNIGADHLSDQESVCFQQKLEPNQNRDAKDLDQNQDL